MIETVQEIRGRVGYIHQYRERGLAVLVLLALLAHFLGASVGLAELIIFGLWWVLSLQRVRQFPPASSPAGVYRLELAWFVAEAMLLAVLAFVAPWPLLVTVLCFTLTIIAANFVLPPRMGFACTLLVGSIFILAATIRLDPSLARPLPHNFVSAAPAAASGLDYALLLAVALFFLLVGTTTLHFARMLNSKATALADANLHLRKSTQELRLHRDHLEEIVRQRTTEVERVSDDLRRANLDLAELNRVKSNFLANVSHEMRTPLTSIRAFSEILISYPNEDVHTRGEFVETIIAETDRLASLIDDVLDLAKIEAGKFVWRPEPLRLRQLVDDSLPALAVAASRKGLVLTCGVDPDLPIVQADSGRLRQVLTNLVSNAVKFTDHGSIHVGSLLQPGAIVLFVADTGRGIAPSEIDRVFEKFHQVAENQLVDKPRGSGLGLSICREIVQHHGGRIWVESQPGAGSTFFCSLPLNPVLAPAKTPGNLDSPASSARAH